MKRILQHVALCLCVITCGLFPNAAAHSETFEAGHAAAEIRLLPNEDYFRMLLETFEGARKEIVLACYLFKTNGYGSNYPDRLVESLAGAIQRGVKVRVLLEKEKEENSFINLAHAETAERLRRRGIPVEFDAPSRRTHAKMVVVDREITFVGSHNLTNSGLKYNNEMSLVVFSKSLAEEALGYINDIKN